MAHLKKYARHEVHRILRHNERKTEHPINKDIDPSRSHLNYSLIKDGKTAQERYRSRMDQVYCYNRSDVKTLCSWVITAPKTLDEARYKEFFEASYEFVKERYGEENMIQAQTHFDETFPHLHITYTPIVYDPRHDREKVCANELNNRLDLLTFHRELEEHLLEHGIKADVYTGITKAQGGNKTIEELKRERDQTVERDKENDRKEVEQKHDVDERKLSSEEERHFKWQEYVSNPWDFTQKAREDDEREKE